MEFSQTIKGTIGKGETMNRIKNRCSIKNQILSKLKRGCKLFRLLTPIDSDMLQLYSSILDKLLQPINEETAVVLFNQRVIRIPIARLNSIQFDSIARTKNVLFTHMEPKQIIMRYRECVF